MKALDKKPAKTGNFTYNPDLDNLPIPQIVIEKTERARQFFEKHPLPEHMRRRK